MGKTTLAEDFAAMRREALRRRKAIIRKDEWVFLQKGHACWKYPARVTCVWSASWRKPRAA
jgi:hypothetical protein